jgi:hypothetical protein
MQCAYLDARKLKHGALEGIPMYPIRMEKKNFEKKGVCDLALPVLLALHYNALIVEQCLDATVRCSCVRRLQLS